jgi:hypothetical protein
MERTTCLYSIHVQTAISYQIFYHLLQLVCNSPPIARQAGQVPADIPIPEVVLVSKPTDQPLAIDDPDLPKPMIEGAVGYRPGESDNLLD